MLREAHLVLRHRRLSEVHLAKFLETRLVHFHGLALYQLFRDSRGEYRLTLQLLDFIEIFHHSLVYELSFASLSAHHRPTLILLLLLEQHLTTRFA